jgi:hypothetical protein
VDNSAAKQLNQDSSLNFINAYSHESSGKKKKAGGKQVRGSMQSQFNLSSDKIPAAPAS